MNAIPLILLALLLAAVPVKPGSSGSKEIRHPQPPGTLNTLCENQHCKPLEKTPQCPKGCLCYRLRHLPTYGKCFDPKRWIPDGYVHLNYQPPRPPKPPTMRGYRLVPPR
uniref:Putative secreted protein n=1 Tax=Amblyomma triste TaxID=251400 RepID=A0A023G0I0_AMBTT